MLNRVGELSFGAGKLRILRFNRRVTVQEVLALHPSVTALMAAPMYGKTGVGKCGAGGLTPCTRQLDVNSGVDLPSCRKQSGITFSLVPGTKDVQVFLRDYVQTGATFGLQCYPTLVTGGVNKARREKVSSVAGIGVLPGPEPRFLYIVGAGGTLRDLGDLFIEKGCSYAGYCDAGSSAALYVVGEGWRGIHARAPNLPAWLAVV